MISSLFTIICLSLFFGFLFFGAGVMGSLAIASWENEMVRTFTYIGFGVGGVAGALGVWLHEKGKINGRG